jgi:signal transduction histidine kinase
VLVVEDNEALLDNLAEVVGAAGYQVLRAKNSREATHHARAGFEVALVDLHLPDGDGTALARVLRDQVPGGEVVMLTGNATIETATAAVRAGAFAYLVKPCGMHELLLTVEQALRQARLFAEKQEMARRAHRAERLAAAGTLTAGLSHEIRNPLNAAALQLAVLERRVRRLDPAAQGPLLDPLVLVQGEVRRLERILQDFLQFARPRAAVVRPLSIGPVIERVLDLLSGQADRLGLTLAFLHGELPLVLADEEQIQQALMNLALNALEAMATGGTLTVSAQAEGAELAVYVDDTGPGIPSAQRERIFEPFFTTKAQGSGLGLPLVHAVVAQHSGSLTVGDAPAGGARFTLRLPLSVR